MEAYSPYSGYPAQKSHTRKRVIYAALILVVLILVYYLHRDRVYRKKGFRAVHAHDGKVVPIPCTKADHARVRSAQYRTQAGVVTDVAGKLQTALTGQAGDLPYTVNSAVLTGTKAPGHLSFKAICPAGLAS